MIVFNDSGSAVGIPGVGQVAAGRSAPVDNWDEVKAIPIVSSWLKKGIIREQSESAATLLEDPDDEGFEGDE